MSNFQAPAYHPLTGKLEDALFLDDHYGQHNYGVRFGDGSVFPVEQVRVPERSEAMLVEE